MVPVIQLALFAGALAVSGIVLVGELTSPRALAVLRQLLTGKAG